MWGQDPGEVPVFNYRWEHLLAVERLATRLGRTLGADMEVLFAAVWLHDIVKTHAVALPETPDSLAAAEEAARFLAGIGFPAEKIHPVRDAIAAHEGLTRDSPIPHLESAILWDADKLSKLGATYLLHTLPVRPVFDPRFQGRATDTELMISSLRDWIATGARIVRSMNTEIGRVEGAARLAFLVEFLHQMEDEWKSK